MQALAALIVCAAIALATASAPVHAASPAVEQAVRLGDSDPLAAIAILQVADEAGDLEASAVLGNTLFFAPPPRTNRQRACAIAQRLVQAGRGDGWALLASCQLTGTVASPDRIEAPRASARRAIALGSAQGGVALFAALVADPRFALPATLASSEPARAASHATWTAAERALQAEAWSGLSLALDQGVAMAGDFALAALIGTAAPGNLQRIVDLGQKWPSSARRFGEAMDRARQYQALGGTHASLQQVPQVLRAAQSAAMLGLWRDGGAGCDSLELERTDPREPETDAAWLPVRIGPLAQAFLLSGRWRERWTFAGCGREVPVDIAFAADGTGGARFEAAVAPRSIVHRTP